MNPVQPRPSRRIVELDALRAIAAINLMLFHFTHVYSVKYGYSSPLGFEFPWGKYGVQLFFMLSGVVNALTILRKRSPIDFLAARCLRILPSCYIVIGLNIVFLGLAPLAALHTWSSGQMLANMTVLPNLFGYECLEPVMWTLQVEILFYGVLLFLFSRGWLDRPLAAIYAWLAMCLVGCLSIDAVAAAWPDGGLAAGLGFLRQVLLLDYFPLFAVGILLHDIWLRVKGMEPEETGWKPVATIARWNLAGIVAALTVFHVTDHYDHNPVVSLGLTVLLAMSLFGWVPVLRCKPLVFVSSISYMLYLLHDNLGAVAIHWMNNTLGLSPQICFAVSLPLTIAVSAAATYWLERPLSTFLRQRWNALRGKTASVPAGTSTTLPEAAG